MEESPWVSKNREALWLKLVYAFSKPISNLFSSTISTIIAMRRYANPVTIHVDLSPTLSSPLKYCTQRESSTLL